VASSSAREAQPPRDFAAQVSQSRLSDDVVVVAKPRPPGSDAWRTVQDLCATRLSAAGFEVTRTEGTGPVNVVGVKRGTSRPQEHVLLSAHYDHLADCPGADDNASGVAGVLESARVLGGGSFSRTLVVALWDGEEAGMLGSRAWVKAAKAADMTIRAALVLEMIGYRSLEPKTQELPAGFDLLFPEAVQRIHARQQTGDFIALIHNPKAARASALLVEEARRHGLPVEPAAAVRQAAVRARLAGHHAPRASSAMWQQSSSAERSCGAPAARGTSSPTARRRASPPPLLRHALELGERERLAVGRGQHRDEGRDVGRALARPRRRRRRGSACSSSRPRRRPRGARRDALVIDDGAAGDLVDPGPEALVVASVGRPRCMRRKTSCTTSSTSAGAHAARDERPQLRLELAPRAARRGVDHADFSGAQQAGPQQDFPPGFTASMVAEAT
jgi:hypothetical protein